MVFLSLLPTPSSGLLPQFGITDKFLFEEALIWVLHHKSSTLSVRAKVHEFFLAYTFAHMS